MKLAALSLVILALSACRTDHDGYRSDNSKSSASSSMKTSSMETTARGDGSKMTATSDDDMSGRALSMADKTFVKKAAQGGMLEVESSRLALRKAIPAPEHDFAQMMITDHGKANDELEALLRSKGVKAPSTLDRMHQDEVDELKALDGPAFVNAFHELQVKDHDDAVALFEKASRECDDADLRSFATQTLPTLRKHRDMLGDPSMKNSR